MSFRTRLILATSTVTLGTLALSLATVYVGVDSVQGRILDRDLLAAATEEASAESQMPDAELAITSAPGPMANSAAPLPKYGVLFNPDGGVRARSAMAQALGAADLQEARGHRSFDPFDLPLGKSRLRAVLVPVPRHEGFALLLAVPKSDVTRDDWLIGGAMLLVFGLALLASIGVVTVVMARLTRGHRAIAKTALSVAEGDLSARVGIREGDAEIVNLAKNIDDMVDRLQRVIEAQQNFVAHAAHELRTPLTTIYGSLALALRHQRPAEEYREIVQEALESVRHLNQLADDLLLLARIHAGDDRSVEPVLLANPIYDAVQSVQGAARDRSVDIRVRETTAFVDGRPRDLERMVRNLIENAVRHSPAGGTVRVETAILVASASIIVQDEGAGVPAAARERIFQPFVRGDLDGAEEGGAGLGLAIAREIARRHGGDIVVEQPDKGARFVVTLPLSAHRVSVEDALDSPASGAA